MNYLITGGAGFIGSHIAEELARTSGSHRIRIFDNLSSGRESNLAAFKDRIEFVRADIRDRDALEQALRGTDVVFHQAAQTSVPGSIADPVHCTEVNIGGTLNVLMAARAAGAKRVVFASSSAIYGENPVSPKREDLAPDPLSPYAASKLAGELYCRIYSRIHGLETACLRYFNVFGPRQDPNSQYAAVIPKFMEAAAAGRPPKVFGDGEQTRDFVFVKDVAQANLLAAHASKLPPAAAFNVGTGHSYSLNQLLKHLAGIVGRDLKAVYSASAAGDIKHSSADISAIQKALGYRPTTSFEEGLRKNLPLVFDHFLVG